MLVVAVGAESEWGRTMALVATEAQPTPLQVPCLPCPLLLPSAASRLSLMRPSSASAGTCSRRQARPA